jgi:hypothetical protein
LEEDQFSGYVLVTIPTKIETVGLEILEPNLQFGPKPSSTKKTYQQ